MHAPVREAKARSRDEILYRRGDEHLAGPGKSEDSSPEVNSDPCHATSNLLAFAAVKAGANGKADAGNGFADGGGAADRTRRAIEDCEEPVARGINFSTSVTLELLPNER
jgi:hypothetical protein